MKFYSEKLNTMFDSEKDLVAAEDVYEAELATKQAKTEKLKKERKERAAEVEAAHKKYLELLNAFLADYKTYHYSYHSDDGLFTDLFKYTFSW